MSLGPGFQHSGYKWITNESKGQENIINLSEAITLCCFTVKEVKGSLFNYKWVPIDKTDCRRNYEISSQEFKKMAGKK